MISDSSFGIIPVHEHDGVRRFLLVQHHKGHWGFPKGHAEPGESPLDAATRELAEETGLHPARVLDDHPLTESYVFTNTRGRVVRKTVTYFIGFTADDRVTPQADEVADYAWADADGTRRRLTFDEGRDLLDRALDLLQNT